MSEVIKYNSAETPVINITNTAAARIIHCLKQQPAAKGLRLSVKPTGCSGLSYVMDYVADFKEHDIKVKLDENYIVAIDHASYQYLKWITIDYVKQGLQHKFIFNNPNQTGQCGCGESFTVK